MTKHVVWDPAGGIIIIANSLPNMVGADMLGNVRGRADDASEGPGPGSRRSPLEKPSGTRAGGRGEC